MFPSIKRSIDFFVACFFLRVNLIIVTFCLIVCIVEIQTMLLDVSVHLSNHIDKRFLCTR